MKQYKEIWNNLSQTLDDASYYVCCVKDEVEIRQNGHHTAEFLKSVLQLSPTDTVLEIGCGIGRVEGTGKVLPGVEWGGYIRTNDFVCRGTYPRHRKHQAP